MTLPTTLPVLPTKRATRRSLFAVGFLAFAALYPSGSHGDAAADTVVRWVRPAATAETATETATASPAAPTLAAPARTSVTIPAAAMTAATATASATDGPAATDGATERRFPVVRASFMPSLTAFEPAVVEAPADAETAALPVAPGHQPPYRHPWKDEDAIFVLDGYEFNELNWEELATDERIRGFISKASDGMPEVYDCRNGGLQNSSPRHCKTRWRKYSVTKELYRTRRAMAKALGWKWGAYHMGRPGNPEAQADHFIDFADPQPDEFIAIDLEDNDPDKWMSLEETERFARRVHQRIGRWPALYTNGSTAKTIAARRDEFPILSRLPLWYARFRPEIEGVFPLGNWESYHSWQFLAQINCKRSCAMRPKGTNKDIDVNVVNATEETLDAMWATKDLLPVRGEPAAAPGLMVEAAPESGPAPRVRGTSSYLTAFAPGGDAERAGAVFDGVLKGDAGSLDAGSLKAKAPEGIAAPGTPVPSMRPGS